MFLMLILSLLFSGCENEPYQINCEELVNLGFVSFNPPNQNIFLYDYNHHEQLIFENSSGDTLGFYGFPRGGYSEPTILIDTLMKSEFLRCNDEIRTEFKYEQENYAAYYRASIGNRSIGFAVSFNARLKKDNFEAAYLSNFDYVLTMDVSYDDPGKVEIRIGEDYEKGELISEHREWSVYYNNIELNNTTYENVFIVENKNNGVAFVYSLTEGLVGFIDKDGIEWTFSHYSFFLKDIAANFTLPNPAGEDVSFYDIDGELILLDFWASWCVPCVNEIQSTLIPLYQEYSEQGLTIISVSIDRNLEEWENKLVELDMEWLQLISLGGFESPLFLNYEIYGIPTIYTVDSDRNIITNELRAEELREFVEEYFD